MVVISRDVLIKQEERRNARFRFQVQQTTDGTVRVAKAATCLSWCFRHRTRSIDGVGNLVLLARGPREYGGSDNTSISYYLCYYYSRFEGVSRIIEFVRRSLPHSLTQSFLYMNVGWRIVIHKYKVVNRMSFYQELVHDDAYSQ